MGANLLLLLTLWVQMALIRPVVSQPTIGRKQVPKEFVGRYGDSTLTFTEIDSPINDQLTPEIQEILSPTRVISRYYRGSDGSTLELIITAGNGRHTFHDPHMCMLGSDALLLDIGLVTIPCTKDNVRVLETQFRKTNTPETEMMMCYVVDGKLVQRTEEVRNRIALQTLFGDNGKPSYSFRVTQTSPGTDPSRRKPMLAFISGMWEQIGPILRGQQKGDPSEPPPTPIRAASTQ
jgi:hypothetical protein